MVNRQDQEGERMNSEWIKCSDRLPEKPGRYLVFRPNDKKALSLGPDTRIYYYSDTFGLGWTEDFNGENYVSHWMPLPEEPKE